MTLLATFFSVLHHRGRSGAGLVFEPLARFLHAAHYVIISSNVGRDMFC